MPSEQMVTKDDIKEAKYLYHLFQNGVAPTIEVKQQMIDFYNRLYKTTYKNTTNCSSCISTVFKEVKRLALL